MTLFKQISTRILATSPTIKRRDLVKLTDDIIDIIKRQTSQEVKEVSNTPIPTKPEYQHLVNIFDGVEINGVGKRGMELGKS
jgi:hypothetical protein